MPASVVAVLSVLLIVRLVLVARLAQTRAAELATRSAALDAALRRQQTLQAELTRRALHDPLTGLGNRALVTERLEAALSLRPAGVGLLMCDLDGFKDVNDTFGHPVGDQLLVEVAQRLGDVVAAAGTVARLGGDEFAVLVEDTDPVTASGLAERMVTALRLPYSTGERLLHVSTSVGVVVTDGASTAGDVLRDADLALYAAKHAGKNTARLFTPQLRAERLAHSQLVAGLRDALATEAFAVHYQPIVELHSGRCVAVEALLRWTDRDGRAVPPPAFIPVAEETGLMVPIGAWVLRRALLETAGWYHRHAVSVTVNISGAQLAHGDFVHTVLDALAAAGLPGAALVLEVTESMLLTGTGSADVRGCLTRLREHGVRIAIDDFGTGYSSMASLRHLPVDILKIDKSLLPAAGTTQEPAATAFTRAIIDLGHQLDLQVTAEGVETAEQAVLLEHLQCRYAQGYLFARPAPAATMTAVLDARAGAASGR
ncbi:bifunctional diguanylate cyclase/phosphodiesterase [Dactylosporangium sp. NPDC050688]|uniref:putative bifunctional diguanylate cyclase/phosphodiesterase n=1 Tax=Dactylosporangium sp. NPDC050688 TaxID=3157217 RepID=UPI0033F0F040